MPTVQNTGEPSAEPPQTSKRKRHWTISLLRLGLIAYTTALIMLVVMEPQLVYPGAYLLTDNQSPDDFSDQALQVSKCQSWEYPAQDGSRIVGRLLDRPGAARTVLFFHGNGVKAALLDDWTKRLSDSLNANVLAAEYRGFQNSDVTPHESNLIADGLAAHDAICQHYNLPPQDLILYGRSLGGGCAAAVAAQRNTKTLILDRTFDSAADVAAEKFPVFPVRWLMRNQFDSINRLNNYHGRLIQIHGTPDEVVPIKNGKRLHAAIPSSSKVFLEVPGMYHNDRLPTRLLQQVEQLINQQR